MIGCRFCSRTPRIISAEPLSDARVPPTELEIGARRPLADHQRVAGAAGDGQQTEAPVLHQHAVLGLVIFPRDTEETREGDGGFRLHGDLLRTHPTVGRAKVGFDHGRQPGVRRREGERLPAEVGHRLRVQRVGFEEGQQVERPTGERPAVGLEQRTVADGQAVIGVVVMVEGQPDLLEVVLATQPRCRDPDPLHGRQRQPDQHRDNGDDDEQFDQGEPGSIWAHVDPPPRCR